MSEKPRSNESDQTPHARPDRRIPDARGSGTFLPVNDGTFLEYSEYTADDQPALEVSESSTAVLEKRDEPTESAHESARNTLRFRVEIVDVLAPHKLITVNSLSLKREGKGFAPVMASNRSEADGGFRLEPDVVEALATEQFAPAAMKILQSGVEQQGYIVKRV